MDEKKHVLKIRGLNVSFKTSAGVVNAVRGVDLDLFEGETLAIVGDGRPCEAFGQRDAPAH